MQSLWRVTETGRFILLAMFFAAGDCRCGTGAVVFVDSADGSFLFGCPCRD